MKLGELSPETIAEVAQLPPERLDELGIALCSFEVVADLQVWLRGR
jgi:hypothetical protein